MSSRFGTLGRPVLRAWRRLTSMRTALLLLFLLAIAAVPGSLLPQRPLNPAKVDDYIAAHGSWGSLLNALGMFDVFAAPWFAAIYLLLFVSLIGCLIPRIRVHARALARAPLPAPRNLDRLPESARFLVDAAPAAYAGSARQTLGRRWRVAQRAEPSGALTVSAEKGYSRETGNLLFHIALLAALILVAVGRLYSYQGSSIVRQGEGLCDTASAFDSWKPGRLAAAGYVKPAPFCITRVTKFTATYSATGEPTSFVADLDYQRSPDAPVQHTTVKVNHPLRIEGDRVYLIGHGFSPSITVRLTDGEVLHRTAQFAPVDPTTLQSEGAYKFLQPVDRQGRARSDIGLLGSFSPDPVKQSAVTYTSRSPRVHDPVLGVAMYVGDLGLRGVPQSVYSLDTRHMKLTGAANLRVGQSHTFPNGVTVTFDGWLPWVSLQVSHDPTQGWLLWAAVAMVTGLGLSLGVRRRRIWLRLAPPDAGSGTSPTVVSVGGLARSDAGNFATEFAALVDRLRAAGSSAAPSSPADEALELDDVGTVAAGKE